MIIDKIDNDDKNDYIERLYAANNSRSDGFYRSTPGTRKLVRDIVSQTRHMFTKVVGSEREQVVAGREDRSFMGFSGNRPIADPMIGPHL